MNRTVETLGVALLSLLFGFIIFFPIYLAIKETSKEPLYLAIKETSKEPSQKFEEVDTYKNCVVIRYTPPNSAHYHYFLDCSNETN
jgi:hypothetical protein